MKTFLLSFFVALCLLLAPRAAATTWSDTLVSSANAPSMATVMGTNGYAQFAWISNGDGLLHYAYQDGTGFHSVSFSASTIGVAGLTGEGLEGVEIGIAVDSSNVPHIAFGEYEAGGVSGGRGVWYGTYTGTGSITTASNWSFHRVAQYTSPNGWLNVYAVAIAIDPTVNRPAVSWFLSDSNNPRSSTLYYTTRNSNGSWSGSGSLISDTGSSIPPAPASGVNIMYQYTGNYGDDIFGALSFAISSTGKHAFTCPALDPSTGNYNQLLAGTDLSGSWVHTTLQSINNADTLTVSSAVAFDPSNLPRVAWGNLQDNSTNLETTTNGSTWTNASVMTALQPTSSYGVGTTYAINSNFVELIASEESTVAGGGAPWAIRTATRSGGTGSWTIQTAVTTSDPAELGYEIAAAVGSENNAIIGYDIGEDSDSSGSVRLLTGTISFGSPPAVTGISPNTGTTAGGTSVTLTGTVFTGATAVKFGTVGATNVIVVSPTSITATAPAGTGTVDVTVVTGGGTSATSASDQFTYTAGPSVTAVSPVSGPLTSGTSVTLTGTGFTGATAVTFGSTAATNVTVVSGTSITATAPAGSAGTVDIAVTTTNGTSATSASDHYTYLAAPTITGVSPSGGPVTSGTSVTLTGTAFTGATVVEFGNTAGTNLTVVSATTVTVTAPAGTAGTTDVTVTTVGGASATSGADQFTYVAAPTVTSVSVTDGPLSGTTAVTLTGTNFTNATAVKFGSTNAIGFTVVNATTITATAPSESVGSVNIQVTTAGGTSASNPGDHYAYLAAPTITQISPLSGPIAGGTSLSITGTNFTSTTFIGFAGTAATNVVVNSATSITATAPAGSAGGVYVQATTDGGFFGNGSGDIYTYIAVPTVTGLTVTNGPLGGGTTLTVEGANLTGATAVSFGTASGTMIGNVTATSLTVTSPAGSAGAADVTVTTVGGTSGTSSADQFNYVGAPTVTALTTTDGPLAGTTAVTLTGTNFTAVTAVNFGAVGATNFTVNSATSITATSPGGAASSVYVTVTAAGGSSSTGAPDQFTYVAAPVFSSGTTASGVYLTAYAGSILYQAAATGAPTFGVSSGSLPPGLVLDPSSGDITGTPSQAGSFPVTLSATNAGGTATLELTLGIGKALTAVSLSNLSYTYDGTAKSATVATVVGGLSVNVTYNSSATPPTAAGTYAVDAVISDSNYQGAATGNLVIGSASTTVSWATPSAITYTMVLSGTQLNATANVAGSFVYSPTLGTMLTAGSQTLSVTFTPADTTDYTGSTGSVTLMVNQATAPIGLSNLTPTYDGAALSATATTTPAGRTVTFTYGGVSTPPTTAGTYAVVATISDPNYIGTQSGSLVIGKAVATATLGSLTPTYDGTAKAATATTSPATLAVTFTYDGLAAIPTAAGTYAVVGTINDTDYQGSNTGSLVIGKATAAVTLGNLTAIYTGSPKSATATTSPASMAVTYTYNGAAGNPVYPGNYAVIGTINDSNYQGSGSGTLVIQQGSQTIFFPAPAAGAVGSTVTLAGSSSSGLAVTYTVTGNATLSGNTLTLLDAGPVTVMANQSGNANYFAAAAVGQTITASAKLPQTISAGTLPTNASSAKSFTLNAAASSGLPVTYAVLSGPATVSGSTVVPTSSSGTLIIVLSQAGNASYAAAPSVTISVPIVGSGPRQFFGTFVVTTSSSSAGGVRPDAALNGTIAASVSASNTSATVIGTVGGSAFVVNLTINANGTFSGATTAITAPGSTVSGPLTFAGLLSGNTLSGTIAEIGASFSVMADPTSGSSASIAGYYQASSLDSSASNTYSMVGTQGEVLVIAMTPTSITSGMGTVAANDTFSVTTPQATTVTGSVNPTTTTVNLTVTTATGTASSYSGLAATTTRTDRLINLSSRGMVSGSNVLVSGLIIGGTANKTVLLRGVGPGLAAFGVPGVLAQPRLQLFDSTGNILSDSTAWGGGTGMLTAFALTGAFPLVATSADAAVSLSLAPGQYTIEVTNAGTGAGGIALAEIYDASANPALEYQRLINISTRAFVSSGAANLTGGFIISGNNPKTVLVRGIGPGLTGFGIANALADPLLTVFDSTGTVLAQNDNWGTPVAVFAGQVVAAAADINAADLATGAFTLTAGSKDAALIVTLPPGAYTAQVTGVGGVTGTALVEIYEVPSS